MTSSLTVSQLAECCQAEGKKYQQTGQSNEVYCLELFRRALVEQNQMAWHAIYVQYQALVAAWVHGYSRFSETGEEVDFFVNEAFARFWQYRTKPAKTDKFDTLGQYLRYLKLCAWSAIEDYHRKQRKDALLAAVALEDYNSLEKTTDKPAESPAWSKNLKQALDETLKDGQEYLVARESWIYDLAPRQIQVRHPNIFASAGQVSQIKRNIIKRLRRHPKLKPVVRKMGEK